MLHRDFIPFIPPLPRLDDLHPCRRPPLAAYRFGLDCCKAAALTTVSAIFVKETMARMASSFRQIIHIFDCPANDADRGIPIFELPTQSFSFFSSPRKYSRSGPYLDAAQTFPRFSLSNSRISFWEGDYDLFFMASSLFSRS
jgi:hypothetical protein